MKHSSLPDKWPSFILRNYSLALLSFFRVQSQVSSEQRRPLIAWKGASDWNWLLFWWLRTFLVSYRCLSIILSTGRVIVDLEDLLLAVLTPFAEKMSHISACKFLFFRPQDAQPLKIRHQLSLGHNLIPRTRTLFLIFPYNFTRSFLAELGDFLILLQLPFKSKIRQYWRSVLSDLRNRLFEPPTIEFHDVGNYKSRTLHTVCFTLEIPAAQWTRMLPLSMLVSTKL